MLRRIVFIVVLVFTSLGLSAAGASAAECPNEQLRREDSSLALPDCRAYEMVSPAQKYGYPVGTNGFPTVEMGVDPGGARVSYGGIYPLAGANAGSRGAWLTERNVASWATSSLFGVPGPNQGGLGLGTNDADLRGSTPDQRTSVYFDTTTPPWGALWLVRADGSRQRIADGSTAGLSVGADPGQPFFEGISDDGKHVLFADTDALVPGVSATGNDILYEWVDDGSNGGAGTLRVVNRTDASTPTIISPGPADLGGSTSTPSERLSGIRGLRHAVSDDGSRILFQTPAPVSNGSGGGPLYLREGGTRTVEVSAPTPGHSPAPVVQYLDAAVDGSAVFFWANGQLNDEAAVEGGIYRYDVAAQHLSFVGVAPEILATATGASAPPSAMASDDGSILYYQRGPDVYVNVNGQNRVVAAGKTIVNADAEGVRFREIRDDVCASAGITPNGHYFAFTADDSATFLAQVYRYDETTGTLDHVSIGPSAPSGAYATSVASTCGPGSSFYSRQIQTRVMSDDGRYVFFDTPAALVAQDTNEQRDVYRWHDGEVALLSTGTSPAPSELVGSDATGSNAFFVTTQRLVQQDGDSVYDIYDARIDGGFPAAVEAPPCSGDSCQGPPSNPPPVLARGSESVFGAGNLTAAPSRPAAKLKTKKAKRIKKHRKKHRKSGKSAHAHRTVRGSHS